MYVWKTSSSRSGCRPSFLSFFDLVVAARARSKLPELILRRALPCCPGVRKPLFLAALIMSFSAVHPSTLRRSIPSLTRQVQRRIPIEKVKGSQFERVPEDGHDRPILGANHMVHADGVPEHDVGLVDRSVRFGPGGKTLPRSAEGRVIPGGV